MRAIGREEGGFTIIEVVVAILLLMVGMAGVVLAIDTSRRNTYRAEQSQVVVNQLQAEMERIRNLPFAEVALTAAPASSADPDDPAWRVSGSQFAVAEDGTSLRPMVINGGSLQGSGTVSGGVLSPEPTPLASGDVNGTIRRYVVWMDDPKCGELLCPGDQDLKRVIVAVTIDSTAAGGTRAYQELHSDLVDPDAKPVDNPTPPGTGDEGSFATLWLTDTPCNFQGRQNLEGDHATHNTLGACSDGKKTGTTSGAPDLMFTDQPALDPSLPPDNQPLYDYATDVEPLTGGTEDRGLQVRHSTLPGCIFSPSILDGVPHQKVHRWLSPVVPNNTQLLLDGEATLSLWTRTLNGATHPGRICVFLFARKLNLLGLPVDVLMGNQAITNATWFPHEEAEWPRGNWTELSVPMDFLYAAGALLPGERLGLAISVETGGTNPGDGLEFMYDHPSFDSRLQVKTSSVLPIF
ncbi:hypothetical protein BH24ACT23_BH24ACT23_08800 [soil metagenome]